MADRLRIRLNRKHAGEIILDGMDDRYALEYASSWLSEGGYPLSPHLNPYQCSSESVRRYLANLLPEGRWLDELSLNTQISRSNIFGLIAAIGSETAGALEFSLAESAAQGMPTSFRPVSRDELTARIVGRQNVSIMMWDGKPRLSLAGVQDKLPLLIRADGQMGFGEGELASTHILKFGTSRAMHLVVNEYICMQLAKRMKLPVADVAFSRFGGEAVLVVRRFDRELKGESVIRRHLIDGCQMLDLPPTYKYERPFGKGGDAAVIRSGANLPDLFATSRFCRVPAAALRDLLNWTLFQLLIGNSDAHGKNISFFVGSGGIEVAPAYDLVCLDMYAAEYDRDYAMAVGDAFDADEITPWQLAEMCERCGLQKRIVAKTLTLLAEKLSDSIGNIELSVLQPGEETDFAHALLDNLKQNAQRYITLASKLSKVVL